MTLLLSTDDAAQVISMETSLASLEQAFADLEEGLAADRPRARVYAHLDDNLYYRYSSMDASVPRYGVHSVRITSEHLVNMRIEGRLSREKPAAAPGGKYVGLIVLFSHQTLAPIAILQDSVVHRYMVGATSALAAKYLAREDARRVGLIGAGLLAGTQLLGLKHVRPIEHVKVHGRRQDRLLAFCQEWSETLGIPVEPATTAREAIAGADIVACATNAHEPVLLGDWLEPGQHVGSLQGLEIDDAVLERAALISCRSVEKETFWFTRGPMPPEYERRKVPPPWIMHKYRGLGEIILGRARRYRADDITFHSGGSTGASSGLGIQDLAVAHPVYEAAKARGLGREIPTDWFLQDAHP